MTDLERALEAANQARTRAYAPYSRFLVGAAVKARGDDRIFAGCNVENASFGATICAERTAITAMVCALGNPRLEFVVVVTDKDPPAGPCGICRQVIAEFADPEVPVHMANPHGVLRTVSLEELLPLGFTL